MYPPCTPTLALPTRRAPRVPRGDGRQAGAKVGARRGRGAQPGASPASVSPPAQWCGAGGGEGDTGTRFRPPPCHFSDVPCSRPRHFGACFSSATSLARRGACQAGGEATPGFGVGSALASTPAPQAGFAQPQPPGRRKSRGGDQGKKRP